MKINFIIFTFLIPLFCFSQNEVIRLEKGFGEKLIETEASFWRDDSRSSSIENVLKLKNEAFEKISNANIITGKVKHRGWIKLDVNTAVNQTVLLEIQNPNIDRLKIYQVIDNQPIRRIENLSKTTPLENRSFRSRTFVEEISLLANQKNTIYLSHDVGYSITNIPIKIWEEGSFLKHQESQKQFRFIFYGILILIMIACFLVGFLLKIRLFSLFGLNVLALILHFLFVNGVLYQTFPSLISNSFFSLDLLIIYSPFLVHILFVRGLTRLDEHKIKFVRILYKFIIWFSVIYFTFTIFLPIWIPIFSHNLLSSIYTIAVLVFPMSLFYFFFALYSSLQRTPFAKFYLGASIVGLMITLMVFFNNGFIKIHPAINYNLLQIGILGVMLTIFIGLLFQIREYFSTVKESKFMPEVSVQIRGNTERLLIKNEVQTLDYQPLTKRETEILKAFANGFTHQEIAEALFISPHTAKTHLKNIYQKLNINSKVEAVRWVMENEG
jgi:DNA-binding CsgD family transcriptional regulator